MATVCMVTGEYPPMVGGIADYTARLVAALRESGETVAVLTDRRALASGACHGVDAVPGWGFRRLPAVIRAIRRRAPDLVHIQYQAAAYALRGAISFLPALLRPTPCLTTFHDTRQPYLFPKAGPLRRWANAVLARDSRAALCTNAADWQVIAGYGQPLVRLIPLGNNVPRQPVTARERQAARARLGADENDLLVGHFGLMGATKGVETLIAAVAALPRARLAFIGAAAGASDPQNAVAAERARAAIAAAGLEQRVAWSGKVPLAELSHLLQACDLVVLPYHDGASFRRTTLIAALANGCATITTAPPPGSRALAAVAGLPELRHGENLWLVPPGDPRALAEAIRFLGEQPAARARLGEAAARAAAAFDWKRIAEQHRQLYRETLGGDRYD
ncbi:MAG: glycosyltransferase family 4 protein [Chloroflexota bacterium]|nr:glycosyltransferase family 4 protein [Dehalococcoidia bacterium]MDW8253964.1 glycosyltransferase family 4 protein [Chloroflexota bacterium]